MAFGNIALKKPALTVKIKWAVKGLMLRLPRLKTILNLYIDLMLF